MFEAGANQFVVWVDPASQYQNTPVALVNSDGYFTSADEYVEKHTDRWGLIPIFFNKMETEFVGISGILVDPNQPLFREIVNAECEENSS